MAVVNLTDIAAPVNRVFQTTLLSNALAQCAHFLGSMEAEVELHHGSLTALWRRLENLTPTVTALSELTSENMPYRTGENITATDTTAALSKYGQVLWLTEEVDLVNFNGQTDKLLEVLGISAGQSLNRLQRNILEDNATAIYTDEATADSGVLSPIAAANIRNANNVLNRNSTRKFRAASSGSTNYNSSPIRAANYGICHSDVEEDIRDLTGFIAAEQYASHTEIQEGEFGMVGGVRFISTEEASIDTGSGGAAAGGVRTTSGNADVYATLIFGMEAAGSLGFGMKHIMEVYKAGDSMPSIQLIQKGRGSGGTSDPLNEVMTMSWKAWHGGAILNGAWVRVIRSAASLLV